MPIYEYECSSCGHRLEAIQKFTDDPLQDCPACSEPGLRRLISAAAFHLKGTGWYATDFKNKGKPAKESTVKEGNEGKESESTEPKAKEKTDSKSEEKPASDSSSKGQTKTDASAS